MRLGISHLAYACKEPLHHRAQGSVLQCDDHGRKRSCGQVNAQPRDSIVIGNQLPHHRGQEQCEVWASGQQTGPKGYGHGGHAWLWGVEASSAERGGASTGQALAALPDEIRRAVLRSAARLRRHERANRHRPRPQEAVGPQQALRWALGLLFVAVVEHARSDALSSALRPAETDRRHQRPAQTTRAQRFATHRLKLPSAAWPLAARERRQAWGEIRIWPWGSELPRLEGIAACNLPRPQPG